MFPQMTGMPALCRRWQTGEIMRGFEDRFEPEAAITREEMAKVIADAYFTAGGVGRRPPHWDFPMPIPSANGPRKLWRRPPVWD